MSKSIELLLQARLESSGTLEQAKALGTDLAKAVSDAFGGVGAQVAESIYTELAQKLRSSPLASLVNMSGGGMPGSPGGGQTVINNYYGPGGGSSQGQIPSSPGNAPMGGMGSGATSAGRPMYNPFDLSSMTRAQDFLFSRMEARNRDPEFEQTLNKYGGQNAASASRTIDTLRLRKEMSKADPNHAGLSELTPSGDELKSAKGTLEGTFGALSSEVKRLIDELAEGRTEAATNRQAIEKNNELLALIEKSPEQRQKYTEEQIKGMQAMRDRTSAGSFQEKEAEINRASQLQQELRKKINLLDEESTRPGREEGEKQVRERQGLMRKLSAVGTVVGGVGAVMGFASNVMQASREGDVGEAQVRGFQTRSLAHGRAGDLYADSFMGGEAGMRRQAQTEVGLSAGGKLLGGAGAALGAAALATGPIGWGIGLAGAGVAASGALDFLQMDKKVANRMGDIRGQSGLKNQESMDLFNSGFDRAAGSFETARDLGDTGMSDFIYNPGALRTGGSLGMSAQATTQMLGGIAAGSMGGTGLDDGRVQSQLEKNMRLQARGFSNMGDVSAGMFTGMTKSGNRGSDLAEALKTSEEMFARAFGSGMNIAKIPEVLAEAAREASQGTGASDQAMENLNRTLDVSKQLGLTEGNDVGTVQKTISAMDDASRGHNMFGQARQRSIGTMADEVAALGGRKMSATELGLYKSKTFGLESIEELFDKDDPERRNKALQVQRNQVQNQAKYSVEQVMRSRPGMSKEDAALLVARDMPVSSTVEGTRQAAATILSGASTPMSEKERSDNLKRFTEGQDKDDKFQQAAILRFKGEATIAAEGINVMANALPNLNAKLKETIATIEGFAKDSDYGKNRDEAREGRTFLERAQNRASQTSSDLQSRYIPTPKAAPMATPSDPNARRGKP